MIRNAMFARVQLCARDDLDGLVRLEREAADRVEPPREVVMGRSAWDAALEEYYAEHDSRRHRRATPAARRTSTVGPEERGSPPARRRARSRGSGGWRRPSPTPPATATG